MSIILRSIGSAAAEALAAGRLPPGVQVTADYPTEFSAGVGRSAGAARALGPFFIHRAADDVVVGEIGGAFVGDATIEIGYAIVGSCWGKGYATEAVRSLVERARTVPDIELLIAHTPLDRPASGRVLAKAGFTLEGETDDEHEGVPLRVQLWHLRPSRA